DYTTWVAGADERRRVQVAMISTLHDLFPHGEDESWKISKPGAHTTMEWLSPARAAHAAYVWSRTDCLVTAPRAGLALAMGDHYATRGDRTTALSMFRAARTLHEDFVARDP